MDPRMLLALFIFIHLFVCSVATVNCGFDSEGNLPPCLASRPDCPSQGGGSATCEECFDDYGHNSCFSSPDCHREHDFHAVNVRVDCVASSCSGCECFSGDLHVHLLRDDGETELAPVKELAQHDRVRGLDTNREEAWCTVAAVGVFAEHGVLYGNYTREHMVLRDATVEEHGAVGEETEGALYNMLTSCPVVTDEMGTRFTAVDKFCGVGTDAMSWSDYVLLHATMLKVVEASGAFWFHGATYNHHGNSAAAADGTGFKYAMHNLCASMLACAKDAAACDLFEDTAMYFVDEYVHRDAQEQTRAAFPALGAHNGAPGSVTFVLVDGGGVNHVTSALVYVLTGVFAAGVLALFAWLAYTMHARRASSDADKPHVASACA